MSAVPSALALTGHRVPNVETLGYSRLSLRDRTIVVPETTQPMSTPAVELRGITKQFGGVLANAGVNLRVQAGAIHGVIGENGAGKSTAMKILYGMIRPDS